MPSYRVTVEVLGVRPGVRPEVVLPTAERILAKTHTVEDRLIEVARATSEHPRPELHLRFVVPVSEGKAEDAEAESVVRVLLGELDAVARCGHWQLWRGPGRRWRPIAAGHALSEQ